MSSINGDNMAHGVRGISAVEAAIVVALVGGFLGAATVYHRQLLVRTKELALTAELRNLRASLMFFEDVHQRRPASLEELVEEMTRRLRIRGGSEAVVDVFGHAYAYNFTSGQIHSQTSGYETW